MSLRTKEWNHVFRIACTVLKSCLLLCDQQHLLPACLPPCRPAGFMLCCSFTAYSGRAASDSLHPLHQELMPAHAGPVPECHTALLPMQLLRPAWRSRAPSCTPSRHARARRSASTRSPLPCWALLCSWKAKLNVEDMCRDQWAWASQNPAGYLTGASEEELKIAKEKGLL